MQGIPLAGGLQPGRLFDDPAIHHVDIGAAVGLQAGDHLDALGAVAFAGLRDRLHLTLVAETIDGRLPREQGQARWKLD
jgi:hypothetical protein